MLLSNALALLDGKPELTADDANALRKFLYGDGSAVTPADAEALFKLNADAGSHSQEWRQLFIEAMTDFVVRQEDPSGYIGAAKADWLIDQVKKAGRVREDEIEMLIHSLEEADQSPAALSNFVLDLVKALILTKLKQNQKLDRSDVEQLRRVIYSKGGDGNIAVTRHEAEALFDINDTLKGTEADPAWIELFKRAVANAVLFESAWHPDRETARNHETWLADTGFHPLRRMVSSFASPGALREMSEETQDLAHLDLEDHFMDRTYAAQTAAAASAETLSDDEAHWLLERLRRNGLYDRNEQAVVSFIRDNAQNSGPQVAALIAGLDDLASKAA